MALVVADRVRETTTSTGTGTITLGGAQTGYQAFSVIGDGNTTYYNITAIASGAWEVGIGTYTAAGNTLSRTTVLSSSNGGALVPFSAGVKDVILTQPASRAVYLDSAGTSAPFSVTGSSGSVANALTVGTNLQLNTGSTFNGSAARTISLAPSPTVDNLYLSNSSGTPQLQMTFQTQSTGSGGPTVLKRGNSSDINGAVAAFGELGYYGFFGWNGTQYRRAAYFMVSPRESFTSTASGGQFQFYTTTIGTNTETLRGVWDSGGFGIGNNYTPKSPLHIYGGASGLASPIAATQAYIEDDVEAALTFATPNTAVCSIYFQRANSTSIANLGYLQYDHANALLTGIVEGTRAFTVKSTATVIGNSTSPFTGTTGQGGASFAAGGLDVRSTGRTVLEVRSTAELATIVLSPTSANARDIHISANTSGGLEIYQYALGSAAFNLSSAGFLSLGNNSGATRLDVTGAVTLRPTTTPSNPGASSEARVYIKGDKYIVQYNDAGTIRYKYLTMSGTGVTWTASTAAP